MKKVILFTLGSFIFLTVSFAQQSTTGPYRPKGVSKGIIKSNQRSVNTISGVPSYIWHRGCGPTALGMVVGYYDTHGFADLIEGDASTQTSDVNDAIANDDHYDDYSLPKDWYPNLETDKSQFGGAHYSNCIGDFMNTSWSSRTNYWGWSWSSDIGPAFTSYVWMRNSNYIVTTSHVGYYTPSSWSKYMTEIDNNRPVVLLVDSNGDGYTDHFVTGVGYDDTNILYAIYDTWDHSIHWYQWRSMSSSYTWGVYNFRVLKIQFDIQASASPVAGGTVSGSGAYYYGETANMIATASPSYSFINWTEGGSQVSTNSNFSFSVSENRTLVANFNLQTFITVTSPNGGENWQQGTQHAITWGDNISENVKIELFKGGIYNSIITASTPSDGSFNWDIPGSQTTGSDYSTKITSVTSSTVYDFSDSYFTVEAPTPPTDLDVQNITITAGQTECFDATNTIFVAGSGTNVDILSGGTATFIAGNKVIFDPGFHSHTGSHSLAYITTTSNYCNQQPMMSANVNTQELQEVETVIISEILHKNIDNNDNNDNDDNIPKLFPNPTSGSFTIDFIGKATTAEIHVLNFQGNRVFKSICNNQTSADIDISRLGKGMYIVVIKSQTQVLTKKIIKVN